MGDHSPENLVVAEANREAALLLANWRTWPGGALALIGPQGSGKTHLALAWALENGARQLAADSQVETAARAFDDAGAVWIDDADGPHSDETLIRVLDLAKSGRGPALLVGASLPKFWQASIPDLRSRLAALGAAILGEPDKFLLEVVLRRHCRERFIELGHDAQVFLVENMGQSFAAAHAVAQSLDELMVRGRKPVTVAQARRALAAAEQAAKE
ncbi:MAG: hypothetical protein ABW199_04625 [Caulobacterales bacterium]